MKMEEEGIIFGVVEKNSGKFEIVFPRIMKKKILYELKKATNGKGVVKLENNKIIIILQNCYCPHTVSELAYHIGEVVPGVTIDARTIPIDPNEISL